jgi:hypothetical protein
MSFIMRADLQYIFTFFRLASSNACNIAFCYKNVIIEIYFLQPVQLCFVIFNCKY